MSITDSITQNAVPNAAPPGTVRSPEHQVLTQIAEHLHQLDTATGDFDGRLMHALDDLHSLVDNGFWNLERHLVRLIAAVSGDPPPVVECSRADAVCRCPYRHPRLAMLVDALPGWAVPTWLVVLVKGAPCWMAPGEWLVAGHWRLPPVPLPDLDDLDDLDDDLDDQEDP